MIGQENLQKTKFIDIGRKLLLTLIKMCASDMILAHVVYAQEGEPGWLSW